MANTTEEIDRMYSSIDEALESLERTFVARAEKKGSLEECRNGIQYIAKGICRCLHEIHNGSHPEKYLSRLMESNEKWYNLDQKISVARSEIFANAITLAVIREGNHI